MAEEIEGGEGGHGLARCQGLAEDVRYYGKWMREEAEKRIGHLYPNVNITNQIANGPAGPQGVCWPGIDGHRIVLGADGRVPKSQAAEPAHRLVRSFWLSKKKGKQCYARTYS